ncbi:glutaredoxin domain-containing protein [Parahaliea maris]|nr:glutaredoxin domain-containing protein [Parahaliea maris]
MFALEWCEFCWSVRKLFGALGVEYHSVDLDSVEFQNEDRGVRIRAALRQKVDSPTIPQIFIGGEHIGGCSELFTAYRSGALQQKLAAVGISLDGVAPIDIDRLLPQWLHPRKSA